MRCLPLADDCGASRPVTEIILHCIDTGSLLGASVLAGGSYAWHAARELGTRLYHRPGLQVGVHLNLLEGHCMAPPRDLPLLVDAHGWFRKGMAGLCMAVGFGSPRTRQAAREQIIQECCAQIDSVRAGVSAGLLDAWRARSNGPNGPNGPNGTDRPDAPSARINAPCCPPLYLDGHLHVHAIPALQPVLGALLERYSFSRVRTPVEPRYLPPASLRQYPSGLVRRELLGLWGSKLRSFLARHQTPCPDIFLGSFASTRMTLPILAAGLDRAQRTARPAEKTTETLVEIMFHPYPLQPEAAPHTGEEPRPGPAPRYAATEIRQRRMRRAYLDPGRQAETRLLLSPEYHRLMARHDPDWAGRLTPDDSTPRQP